jgi:palmitoyl-protein thioesterase
MSFSLFFRFVLSFTLVFSKPIVLMHGILSSDSDLDEIKLWFEENTGNKVHSIEVGNGQLDSISKTMSWQLDYLNDKLKLNKDIQKGFHFVGLSQGGLLARGYAEIYNNPPVASLVTFGTPHSGVYYYDIPDVYGKYFQEHYSIAGYWKDPYRYGDYIKNASYLPYINNEKNTISAGDIIDVENFVMVWSKTDGFIIPEESCKFEFFADDTLHIIPLRESKQYIDNLIGLKTLDETSRLHFVESSCVHNEYKTRECMESIRDKILRFFN